MKWVAVALIALISTAASAEQYVKGYCKKDGTCVQGHFKTSPNGTALDNYSTRGNFNPNTGKVSTRDLETPTSPSQQPGGPLQIGPRGGQYYVNESGKRVYVREK